MQRRIRRRIAMRGRAHACDGARRRQAAGSPVSSGCPAAVFDASTLSVVRGSASFFVFLRWQATLEWNERSFLQAGEHAHRRDLKMKGHENYHVHCHLKELMTHRNMTVDQLHEAGRVGRETISQLRGNNSKAVSTQNMARICGALGVGLGDLFEVLPNDIWLPIRLTKEVTIHFGLRTFTEPRPARSGGEGAIIGRQYLGSWDFRAFKWISEYLMGLKADIRVRFEEHITGAGRGIDPAVRALAQRIFASGNHIVIASPVANQFAEEVVCHAYGVAPYNPQMRGTFPYGFVWDDWRQVRSSFGWQGHGNHFGIAALPSNKIVAPHVIVASGEGTDGALILVYRVFQAPSQREVGDDDERIVICLLGYSGPGTLGAAQLATNPEFAAGLYPQARMMPRMRAVACKYFREASALCYDNREVTAVKLIPEHKPSGSAGPASKARAAGEKPRR
jgi:DNA-binding Xre family transcriptional regulator